METVAGLFDRQEDAERAVHGLKEAGFMNQHMSVVARQAASPDQGEAAAKEIAGKASAGALGGSLAGGLAGLLVGLGLLIIPGIGPALAAGSLAAALGSTAAGAGLGAAAGGLIGALAGMGISEETAEVYAEGIKRGGVLVLVESEAGRSELAQTILDNAGAVNVDARRSQWLADGWTHFDENVIPPSQFPGGISTL